LFTANVTRSQVTSGGRSQSAAKCDEVITELRRHKALLRRAREVHSALLAERGSTDAPSDTSQATLSPARSEATTAGSDGRVAHDRVARATVDNSLDGSLVDGVVAEDTYRDAVAPSSAEAEKVTLSERTADGATHHYHDRRHPPPDAAVDTARAAVGHNVNATLKSSSLGVPALTRNAVSGATLGLRTGRVAGRVAAGALQFTPSPRESSEGTSAARRFIDGAGEAVGGSRGARSGVSHVGDDIVSVSSTANGGRGDGKSDGRSEPIDDRGRDASGDDDDKDDDDVFVPPRLIMPLGFASPSRARPFSPLPRDTADNSSYDYNSDKHGYEVGDVAVSPEVSELRKRFTRATSLSPRRQQAHATDDVPPSGEHVPTSPEVRELWRRYEAAVSHRSDANATTSGRRETRDAAQTFTLHG
jgi:hypothetical protein